MPDPARLPHLVRLVGDDSPVVSEAVQRELAAYGPSLDGALDRLDPPPGPDVRSAVLASAARGRRDRLRREWPGRPGGAGDSARLEAGLALLSEHLSEGRREPLPVSLDRLAEEARRLGRTDARGLADLLFRAKGLRGAVEDYYEPRNSDLAYVIAEGRGLPISLACVYRLVGDRLGLRIGGCNFPGHFMARVTVDGTPWLVDCFDRGRFIDEREAAGLLESASGPELSDALRADPDAPTVLARVLSNLAHAYARTGADEDAALMEELRARTAPAR